MSRRLFGPRALGVLSLSVIGLCGAVFEATELLAPTRATTLSSRSSWELAHALPAAGDFPADWNYGLDGRLRPGGPPPPAPRVEALAGAPGECARIPTMAGLYGTLADAATVHVDLNHDTVAHAQLMGAEETDPNAHFVIWVRPDGAALIGAYRDWLGRCGSYRITLPSPDGRGEEVRAVETRVDAHPGNDDSVALAVSRSSVPEDGSGPPVTYRIEYYAVRGVLLECATDLTGADAERVQRLCDQTRGKLRAL